MYNRIFEAIVMKQSYENGHTKETFLELAAFKLKCGMRLKGILSQSSLYSEEMVTVSNWLFKIFLNDRELVSDYLNINLGKHLKLCS